MSQTKNSSNSLQYSFANLVKSFKLSIYNLFQNKLCFIIICILLGFIIICSIKDGNIDLFDVPTTTRIAPEDPSDLEPIYKVVPTNAFTAFNMNFINLYKDYKSQSQSYINQMEAQGKIIDNLNNRASVIVNS